MSAPSLDLKEIRDAVEQRDRSPDAFLRFTRIRDRDFPALVDRITELEGERDAALADRAGMIGDRRIAMKELQRSADARLAAESRLVIAEALLTSVVFLTETPADRDWIARRDAFLSNPKEAGQ